MVERTLHLNQYLLVISGCQLLNDITVLLREITGFLWFGFNGKLNDDDVRGSYQTLEFGGRDIYNPRISRFFSIDPVFEKYPWQSSYIFANNRPIQFIDYEGLGVNGGFSVVNQSSQPIHITGSGAIGKLISQSEKPTEPNIRRNQET